MQKIWWTFLGIIVCVAGGCVLWFGGKEVVLAGRSNSWPSVAGKVTELRVNHSTHTNRGLKIRGHRRTYTHDMYTPVVKYSYTVNGAQYNGDTIAFGMGSYGDKKGADAVVDKYTTSNELNVYYDPGNPGTSVLQRGNMIPGLLACGGGILMLAIGIAAPFFLPDKPRSPREEKPAAHESTDGGADEGFKF